MCSQEINKLYHEDLISIDYPIRRRCRVMILVNIVQEREVVDSRGSCDQVIQNGMSNELNRIKVTS